ncbi:MAG: hypothetical protein AAF125_17685 [Chloroflexota bacterium]
MADDNRKKDTEIQTEQEFVSFGKDLARLVGKFMWDLTKLTGRGLVTAYRAIGRRRMAEVRSGEAAGRAAQNVLDNARDLFQREKDDSANETAAADAMPRKGVGASEGYVDMDAAEDREAASMLEDLLQNTAAKLRGDAEAETVTDAEAESGLDEQETLVTQEGPAIEIPVEGAVNEPGTVPNVTTGPLDPKADAQRIEEMLRQREEQLLSGQRATPEASDDEIPTYKQDPRERAKIDAQLQAREEMLKAEKVARQDVSAAKDARQQDLAEKVAADRARIDAERRAKRERYAQAEAERKALEAAKREAARLARLGDAPPTDNDDTPPSDGDGDRDVREN